MSDATHHASDAFSGAHSRSNARRVRALECRTESGTFAIAVDAVGQIVEYDVAPLPLARGSVRGLGLVEGRLVVSLGIGPRPEGRRRTKGLLLRTAKADGHWALEVAEVVSFVEVVTSGGEGARAATDDDRELAWIDPESLVAGASTPFEDEAAQ
jgi:hypothetical protein